MKTATIREGKQTHGPRKDTQTPVLGDFSFWGLEVGPEHGRARLHALLLRDRLGNLLAGVSKPAAHHCRRAVSAGRRGARLVAVELNRVVAGMRARR
jgi:hypothetical protein